MRTFTNILIILTSLILGCNRYDDFDCNSEINSYRIPLFYDNSCYYMITSNYYQNNYEKDLPLSTLIKYYTLKDSVDFIKLKLNGVPLVFHKNDAGTILLVTSKCVYSLDSNNNIKLEVNYNSQNNLEIIGKTIYDYKDDKIYIRPGIDNPNHEIYEINQNSYSSNILNNKLSESKFTLVDFNFIKNNNNIDYIFTDGNSFTLVKNEVSSIKKLSTQDRIYSISYNNIDKEICLGTTNANIYYYDFKDVRINTLKNGITYPPLGSGCSGVVITDINFNNEIAFVNKNYSNIFDNMIKITDNQYIHNFGYPVKHTNFNKILPTKKGNLTEYYGDVSLDLINHNKLHIEILFDLGSLPLIFTNFTIDFTNKKIYFNKKDTSIIKSFEY